jgi:hypothetical protein
MNMFGLGINGLYDVGYLSNIYTSDKIVADKYIDKNISKRMSNFPALTHFASIYIYIYIYILPIPVAARSEA